MFIANTMLSPPLIFAPPIRILRRAKRSQNQPVIYTGNDYLEPKAYLEELQIVAKTRNTYRHYLEKESGKPFYLVVIVCGRLFFRVDVLEVRRGERFRELITYRTHHMCDEAMEYHIGQGLVAAFKEATQDEGRVSDRVIRRVQDQGPKVFAELLKSDSATVRMDRLFKGRSFEITVNRELMMKWAKNAIGQMHEVVDNVLRDVSKRKIPRLHIVEVMGDSTKMPIVENELRAKLDHYKKPFLRNFWLHKGLVVKLSDYASEYPRFVTRDPGSETVELPEGCPRPIPAERVSDYGRATFGYAGPVSASAALAKALMADLDQRTSEAAVSKDDDISMDDLRNPKRRAAEPDPGQAARMSDSVYAALSTFESSMADGALPKGFWHSRASLAHAEKSAEEREERQRSMIQQEEEKFTADAQARLAPIPVPKEEEPHPYIDAEVINRSYFSEISTAYDAHTRKQVILKRALKKGRYPQFLKTEIERMQMVQGPGVVKILDTFEEDGFEYLVMEKMECDLNQLLEQMEPPTEADRKAFMKMALTALKVLHDKDMIHADIKPENLMYTHGEGLKLADFGNAVMVGGRRFEDRASYSTTYRSYELFSDPDRLGKNSDIWAMGMLHQDLIKGKPHWLKPASELEQLRNIRTLLVEQMLDGDDDFYTLGELERSFLNGLVKSQPDDRVTVDAALQHSWFAAEPVPTPLNQLPMYNITTEDGNSRKRGRGL